MVEFGLKLEDNKVSEWSDKYLDYEKLKTLLSKAKSASKKLDDLCKRKPQLAEQIREAYKAGSLTPYSSRVNLTALDTTSSSSQRSPTFQKDLNVPVVDHVPSPEAERELLLKRQKEKYGSQESLYGDPPTDSQREDASFSSRLRTAVSDVSGFFSDSHYEKRVREALKEIDQAHEKFGECLAEEFAKVNDFYNEKYDELDKRLQTLVESVVESSQSGDLPPGFASPLPGHKRHPSSLSSIGQMLKNPFRQSIRNIVMKENSSMSWQTVDPYDEEETEGNEDIYRESDSIQRAITDLYRTSKLLHNFVILNYTGFVKIIKKHDKTFPDYKGVYKAMTVESEVCHGGSNIEALEVRMERLYADWFCDRNLLQARAQLLPKKGDGLQMDWSQLRLGYRMGMCAVLGLWVCWDCIWGLYKKGNSTIGGRTAFPVFRGIGGLVLLHWCWGFSVYVWTRYRVNYIYLFDFNPRTVDSPIVIFNDAVDETLVFLICMLLYYKSGAHDIPQLVPAGIYPFILVLFTIRNLVFPLKSRGPLWKAIREVVTTPFCSPRFFTTYVADVFTSMIKVFQDIAWTIGFVVSGDFFLSEDHLDSKSAHEWERSFWYKNVLIPLICLLPLWFRFNQCLRRYLDTGNRSPNLPNAFKYAMSQTVTLFGAFHPLYLMQTGGGGNNYFQAFWMALFVASSLYSFTWDVFMDWGLGRPSFGFLGPRLMFPSRSTYYVVIAADLVLRFMWVMTLIPPQSGAKFEIPQYLTAVNMGMEIMRRTIWGFLRLENEHRANTGKYRRVDFVPLHFNTGHAHKYKQEHEHAGWSVLGEVAGVSLMVIVISVFSVVAAQRSARDILNGGDL